MAIDQVGYQKTMEQIINDSAKNTSGRNTGELGQQEFLNLLTTQLKYQDPLKPMDDTSFIGQMAQFTALTQAKEMNTNAVTTKAFSLIGKNVVANYTDETTKETTVVQGQVTNVRMADGKVYVVVKGKDVPVENVTEVAEGGVGSSDNLSQYSNLIGSNVDGVVYDTATGSIVGVSGYVKSIQRGMYEDYAELNGVSVDISAIKDGSSTDPNFKEDYLSTHVGKQIDVEIVDKKTGKTVEVKAILRDYTIDGAGKIKATLDQVYVPVLSVSGITAANKGSIANYTNLIGFNAKGSIHDKAKNNYVSVSGTVKSLIAGEDENYAVMDGVSLLVASLNNSASSTDTSVIKSYLDEHSAGSSDNTVSLNVKDAATGQIVTVSGKLDNYSTDADTGKITVKLNQVKVPVDSITNVIPANQG